MKKEKLILSLIATIFGLFAASIAFYLFQVSKTVPPKTSTEIVSVVSPSPTPVPSIFLTVDNPKDEEVVDNRTLSIVGKTTPNAVVIILTGSTEEVITPKEDGSFSTTLSIDEGQNVLEFVSIAPNGESVKMKKIVTYSQEEF